MRQVGCTLHVRGTVINFVTQLKDLGWYIILAKSFKVSFPHLRARFHQCCMYVSVYVKSHNFTEPVLHVCVENQSDEVDGLGSVSVW